MEADRVASEAYYAAAGVFAASTFCVRFCFNPFQQPRLTVCCFDALFKISHLVSSLLIVIVVGLTKDRDVLIDELARRRNTINWSLDATKELQARADEMADQIDALAAKRDELERELDNKRSRRH